MKLAFLLLFSSFLYSSIANEYELEYITCSVAKKDVLEMLLCKCDVKQIWMAFNILKPITGWSIQIDFFQKRGDKLYQVFKSSPVDWCKFNEGITQLVGFQKVFVNAFRKSAPRLFHPCPFEGLHEFNNVTAAKVVVDMIPLGLYKLVLRGLDSNNETLATVISGYKIFKS